MGATASAELANSIFYSVYIRAHGANGTFKDVEKDLVRIKSLGTDIVWLLPIHPIGKLEAKGSLGCPYSISNYREVNAEYGSQREFEDLIAATHKQGMKLIIDVVYHHTAHDSNLISEHPEWYRQDPDGKPQTSVPEWSDIVDLNHPNQDLSDYLIESLSHWVSLGVDGFRCDVASCVPLSFWQTAVERLGKQNPNLIWLAESVNPSFIWQRRLNNLIAHSDAELYDAFHLTYDYDIWHTWKKAVEDSAWIERYVDALMMQDAVYPKNFQKLRFVENHDQKRVMDFCASENEAIAWTAFQAFNKGPFMIYAGQESKAKHTPSLFEKEPVDWKNYELSEFFQALAGIKKSDACSNGVFHILSVASVIQSVWISKTGGSLYGVFSVNSGGASAEVKTQLPDGSYDELLWGERVEVRRGKLLAPKNAYILKVQDKVEYSPYLPLPWRD